MKRLFTSILATSAIAITALADGNITGSVFSKANGEPIDFATVQLINASTKKPTTYGAQTDLEGHFTIAGVKDGRYILRVTNLGSVTQERNVTISGKNVEIGKIQLAEDTKMLEEVVVTGVKGQMHFELDRKVFNVDSNIASAGASASELLESIPSVEVDQDGEVSLRGNSSVTVWINGKESGLTADNRGQILEQIPAETIDRIEVITNPSAKYNPEGTAGIINIILKKDRRSGYFGSAEIGANTNGGGNANVNINYNIGKFETFAGLGFRMRHNKGGSESRRKYDNGDYLNSDATNNRHGNNLFLRLGLTYHLTDRDDFYFSGFGMMGHRWNNSLTEFTSDVPGQWIANANRSHSKSDSRGGHIEWGYKHSWSDSHNLDINVGFNHWGGPEHSTYAQHQEYPGDIFEDVYQKQDQTISVNNWEAKIDTPTSSPSGSNSRPDSTATTTTRTPPSPPGEAPPPPTSRSRRASITASFTTTISRLSTSLSAVNTAPSASRQASAPSPGRYAPAPSDTARQRRMCPNLRRTASPSSPRLSSHGPSPTTTSSR